LGRIIANTNVAKEMREAWALKRNMLLEALQKKCSCKEIDSTLMSLEDCEAADEKKIVVRTALSYAK